MSELNKKRKSDCDNQLMITQFKKMKSEIDDTRKQSYDDAKKSVNVMNDIVSNFSNTEMTDDDKYKYIVNFKRNIMELKNPMITFNKTFLRYSAQSKQMMLLLIRCKFSCEKSTCTTGCYFYKNLFNHITDCTNESCKVKSCILMKEILKHYIRCGNPNCLICKPTRKYNENNDSTDFDTIVNQLFGK
tara:strand:- start:594 stop:1157 length:564 start_codon:yes stop_codon:yes gene_type:complete